jgi:hypothetical protein
LKNSELVSFETARPLIDKLLEQHGKITEDFRSAAGVVGWVCNYVDPEFTITGTYSIEPMFFDKQLLMVDFNLSYSTGENRLYTSKGAVQVPEWVIDKIKAILILDTLAGL